MRRARAIAVLLAVTAAGVWPVAAGAAPRPEQGNAPWQVRPGVEQVTITGAQPHEPLTLWSHPNHRPKRKLLTLLADEHGQAHFAYLPASHLTLQSGPDLDLGDLEDLEHGGVVGPGNYV